MLRSTWIALSSVRWSRGSRPLIGPSPFAEAVPSFEPASAWLPIAAAAAITVSAPAVNSRRFDKIFNVSPFIRHLVQAGWLCGCQAGKLGSAAESQLTRA